MRGKQSEQAQAMFALDAGVRLSISSTRQPGFRIMIAASSAVLNVSNSAAMSLDDGARGAVVESNVPCSFAGTPEPTVELVQRIRAGDRGARETLMRRFLPVLRRWAHGRLPHAARDVSDTDDLVQITLVRVLNHIAHLRLRHPGSFYLYLKQTLLNNVRDEIRNQRRNRVQSTADLTALESAAESTPDLAAQYGDLDAYERALESLPERQQRLIVMRLEFGLSYEEIARECATTPDAARMMVTRAVVRLAAVAQGSSAAD